MIVIPSLRPETRYGIPTADQILFNREYIVGYSYLFRQPRWALELIDPNNRRVEFKNRLNNFRDDLRIPEKFRAELKDYEGSGFDRGHLIASADRRASGILNSETFLLSNMSPQKPMFNRGIWKALEEAVRDLADDYVEVYAICGPLFWVGEKIQMIGEGDVKIAVPHGFFKSVLAEKERGQIDLWSFAIPNKKVTGGFEKLLRPTSEIEIWSGLSLWDRLTGKSIDRLKDKKGKIWSTRKSKKTKVSDPI